MPTDVRPTPIAGVLELVGQPFSDHRGAFLNAFRAQEPAFAQAWGARAIAQVNLSRTEAVGAVRGLHLQAAPHSEAKLVRCLQEVCTKCQKWPKKDLLKSKRDLH